MSPGMPFSLMIPLNQTRTMKLVKGLEHKCYEKQLRELWVLNLGEKKYSILPFTFSESEQCYCKKRVWLKT